MLDLPDTPLDEWNVLKDDQDDVVDVENSLIAEVGRRLALFLLFFFFYFLLFYFIYLFIYLFLFFIFLLFFIIIIFFLRKWFLVRVFDYSIHKNENNRH
jgi:hypothetical protein